MVETEETISRHSFWTYFSFGTYNITWTIPSATMSLYLIFFYHTVVGLDPLLMLAVVAINTIWAGLNDPLIGWITDRNFKWTRKWGRRFPWIAIGMIPYSLTLIMLFSPPGTVAELGVVPIMVWLLFSLFLFDLFTTLVDIHVAILRADKFRTEAERRKYAGSWGFFDMIAQVLGMMLPPLLIFFGNTIFSFTIMAVIIAAIAIIFAVIFISKGAREDEIVIDRYYSREYERLNIFKAVIFVIKQKSFMALYISYVLWLTASTIAIGMVAYLTTFILRSNDPDVMVIYFALFLLGSLISIPLWQRLLRHMNNNKKLYLIGCFMVMVAYALLTFFQTEIDLMIIMFLVGFTNGCVWTIGMPVLYSNVQDDFVVRTGRNQKGILVGTWAVIGLVTAFIDEALIATVFTFTGFEAGIEDFAALVASGANVGLVLLGIRLLLGMIPALVILVGALLFWKFYPLTQEKVLENKAKLLELGF
jgi:GPH family glycoside/pentoside/hexuronide:cation symporter